jgi:hypothetical protein
MPNYIGKRRLLKLADMLEEDAKNRKGLKFDMSDWGSGEDKTKPISCGTTACAMGLAGLSGAFKRAGLKTVLLGDDKAFWIDINFDGPAGSTNGAYGSAQLLFNITSKEADFLFIPEFYPFDKLTGAKGERYVAERIRDFVAGKVGPYSW